MSMKLLLDPAVTVTGAANGGTGATNPPAATPSTAPVAAAVVPPVVPAKPAEPVAASAPGFMAAAAPEAAKPVEEKKPDAASVPAVPKPDEKWALKIPEGVKLQPEHIDAFEKEMKSLGLDSEKAQKILDRDLAHDKAQIERYTKQADEQLAKWHGDLKAKWGDKFADMDAKVKRVFDHGDPTGKFRAALSNMKLQYAPELMDFVERFAPMFADPRLNPPSQAGVTVQDTRSVRERLTEDYQKRMSAAS